MARPALGKRLLASAHRGSGPGPRRGRPEALRPGRSRAWIWFARSIRRRQIQFRRGPKNGSLDSMPSDAVQAEAQPDAMNGRGRVAARPAERRPRVALAASLPASPEPLPRWRRSPKIAARRGGVRSYRPRGPPPHSGDATCPRRVRARLRANGDLLVLQNLPPPPKTIRSPPRKPLRPSCDDETSASNSAALVIAQRDRRPPLSPSIRAS